MRGSGARDSAPAADALPRTALHLVPPPLPGLHEQEDAMTKHRRERDPRREEMTALRAWERSVSRLALRLPAIVTGSARNARTPGILPLGGTRWKDR